MRQFETIWRTSDFEAKFAQKNMTDKNFEKIDFKIVISTEQCIPLPNFCNLENVRFWDQISSQKVNEKNLEKVNIKIVISVLQCISVPNFSQFGKLQFLGLNLPKNTLGGVLGQTQPENNLV